MVALSARSSEGAEWRTLGRSALVRDDASEEEAEVGAAARELVTRVVRRKTHSRSLWTVLSEGEMQGTLGRSAFVPS